MAEPRELDPSDSLLALFGCELRRYRLSAGMSQEQLGRQGLISGSLVGMIETAQRMARLDFAQRADEALGTGGALARLWHHMGREGHPSWFRAFADFEREAVSLRWFEPLVIPGLLQTEDYARAVLQAGRPADTDEQVEELVTARMERKAILSGDDPPLVWVVVDESALWRPIGGKKIMADQLEYLVRMARQPRITVQVVPWDAGAHAGLAGPFIIAQAKDGTSVVYLDSVASGRLIDRTDDVRECGLLYDSLQVEALPREASIRLIEHARQRLVHDG